MACDDRVVRREIAGIEHAQHAGAAEEQHIAFGFDIVAEGFGRDDEQRLVFQAGHEVIAQGRAVVLREDADRDITSCGAAAAVADRIFKARIAIEVGPRLEDNLAQLVNADLSVIGKTLDADESQAVAVRVAVVCEQCRGINDDRLVF